MTDMNKLENLFEDEAFLNTLKNAATAEDVTRILAENGVEITAEEAQQFIDGRTNALEADELDEEMMDAVAGGINVHIAVCFGFGVASGLNGNRYNQNGCAWYKAGYFIGSQARALVSRK